MMDRSETPQVQAQVRSEARKFVALLVIATTTAMALGLALKLPTQLGANDISRWCTVWSLLERGTYAIDDCPWQARTQDKVEKEAPFGKHLAGTGQEPVKHFYSSKPPLLPTLIAAVLVPVRVATGVPLDHVLKEERSERWVEKPIEGSPGKTEKVLEKPKEPVEWPVYVFYLKPAILLLNVLPLWVMLVLYARLLDRIAPNDWAWFLCLVSAALATFLLAFDSTLNNHTIAAFSAFFALYPFLRIWDDGVRSGWSFAAAGFFGAFCACNEIPAALFGILLFLLLLVRFPRSTLLFFVPTAAIPCAAFLVTQYLAFGQFKPVYEEFGTKSYLYYGSYWSTPLEMDYFNVKPESYGVYLFHMTLGHHGVFSLTPIFLFSILGALRCLFGGKGHLRALGWVTLVLALGLLVFTYQKPEMMRGFVESARITLNRQISTAAKVQGLHWLSQFLPAEGSTDPVPGRHWLVWLLPIGLFTIYGAIRLFFARGKRLYAMAGLTLFLTVALLAFYTWNPKARNYGGSTQGLRWLFWLIPFWLVMLPAGVEGGQKRRWVRWLSLAALAVSVFSVGYALRSPWSHPWILDALEHLNLYSVKR
jgi:hypothetical protein